MSIASYSDLLVQVTRLMDGEDVTATELTLGTLNQIVGQAERRIYREVRSRHNEKAFSSLTVTSNLATLPTDFEASSVVHFGKAPLLPVPEEWLREYLNNGATGDCKYFAEAGASFMFGPSVADATTVQGRYFYRHPDLTSSTFAANTLMANEPDLFVHAILAEGVAFFAKDPRYWEAKYQDTRDRINAAKNRTAYSAGRIRIRPSTQLMG